MRKILLSLAAIGLCGVVATAQTFKGSVVKPSCNPPSHTHNFISLYVAFQIIGKYL